MTDIDALSSAKSSEMFSRTYQISAGLLLLLLPGRECKKYAGPFDIDWYLGGLCDELDSSKVKFDIKVVDHRRGRSIINGSVSLPWGMNDSITADIKISSWKNRAWNNFFSQNFGGLCSAYKRYLPEATKAISHLFQTNDCLRPGVYPFNNVSIPTKVQGFAIPFYGKVRVDLDFLKIPSYKKIGCFFMEADILPKKMSQPKFSIL